MHPIWLGTNDAVICEIQETLTFLCAFIAFGPARCAINNGGCWSESRNGFSFSACSVE